MLNLLCNSRASRRIINSRKLLPSPLFYDDTRTRTLNRNNEGRSCIFFVVRRRVAIFFLCHARCDEYNFCILFLKSVLDTNLVRRDTTRMNFYHLMNLCHMLNNNLSRSALRKTWIDSNRHFQILAAATVLYVIEVVVTN